VRSGTPTPDAPADVLRVLDSTVLIDHLRGRPVVARIAALRAAGDIAATTAVNVEEIVRGLRPAEAQAAVRLFTGLVVLPVDTRAGWQAGEWRRTFAARGITLWQADCLIAATAAVHGGSLVTGNPKDFPMPDVDLVHWPVGS
jgi:predicted nucleic acid-binding protein